MYKLIGTDGKHYGPVPAEVVKRWIAERRAERRTPVLVEGTTAWTVLGLLPEFSADFAPQSPPVITQSPAAQPNGFATAGMVCGILSFVCICCCGFPFSILGIVFSLIALAQISNHPGRYEGRSQAIVGLVLSLLSIALEFIGAFWSMLLNHPHVMFNTNVI